MAWLLPPWHKPHCYTHPHPAAAPGKYPALSPAQQHKLKLLTIVSAADGTRTLAYEVRGTTVGWCFSSWTHTRAPWHVSWC